MTSNTSSKPVLLGRDAILKADDRPTEDVPVPEWGGVVRVRGLDGHGRDAYETETIYITQDGRTLPNTQDARAKLAARCIVDETGERIFTDQDINVLSAKSAIALNRVWEKAMAMSGLSEADMDELAGKSGSPGPGSDSPSA